MVGIQCPPPSTESSRKLWQQELLSSEMNLLDGEKADNTNDDEGQTTPDLVVDSNCPKHSHFNHQQE